MPEATILIVEDEAIVAADLTHKLVRLGYTVCGSTAYGEDALALVRETCPDLVLMDVRLAGEMDGVAAAEQIRRDCDVAVIYLTAHADRATLDRAKHTEPFGYLLKPFEERELESHIEMALYKHQAERKLRESEARFRTVLENSRDVIYRMNAQTGCFEYISPACAAVVGYTPAELMAQTAATALTMIHPDDRLALQMAHECLVTTGVGEAEYRQRAKSGEYRWISNRMSLTRDESGQPRYRDGSIRDITERKQAEEALQKSRDQFSALIQNVDAGVALIDEYGKFIIVNPVFLRLFGLADDPDNILNINDQDWSAWQVYEEDGALLPVDDHPVRKAAMTGQAVRNKPVGMRLPSGGDLLWMLVSAEPILQPDGSIELLICTYHDITELHAMQEQMKTFLQLVSHDLRAPLTIANGHVSLLKESLAENDNRVVQMSIDAIRRAIKRMDVMIDDLVTAARLEGRELPINCTRVDLSVWLPEFLERSSTVLNPQRIQLELPATLPTLHADADRLERILTNLISNALKYSDPGTPVRVQVQPMAGEVCVMVKDQGQGIAPQDIPHLFEKFYRAGSSRKAEGIGLGLYVTRLMLEAQGGGIRVESEVGQGSTFSFTLPVVEDIQ